MNSQAYLFCISRADGTALHQLRREIGEDPELDSTEKDELFAAINRKFGQLNLAAVGPQKARWS